MKMINSKKMKFLTKRQQESYENAKTCYIYKKFERQKKYHNVINHCNYTRKYRGATHSICNLKYSVPKKIFIVFHNGTNYDYYVIIKETVEEF